MLNKEKYLSLFWSLPGNGILSIGSQRNELVCRYPDNKVIPIHCLVTSYP